MQTINLDVKARQVGQSTARALRREGSVPCVLYGSHTEPVHFSASALDLRPLIHTAQAYLVSLSVAGEAHECIVKKIDFHPVTDAPIHLDFQALTRGEAITITVPIHLEGLAKGVKDGGNLSQPLTELEIRCLPIDIPGQIIVDVSRLNIGDSIHVSDLTFGENVELLTDPSMTLVNVAAPRVEVEPDAESALELSGAGADAGGLDEAEGDSGEDSAE